MADDVLKDAQRADDGTVQPSENSVSTSNALITSELPDSRAGAN